MQDFFESISPTDLKLSGKVSLFLMQTASNFGDPDLIPMVDFESLCKISPKVFHLREVVSYHNLDRNKLG